MDFFSTDKYTQVGCPFLNEAPNQFIVVHLTTNGRGRFIVAKEIRTGRCSGHSYHDNLRTARINMDRSSDHVYDAVLRTRVL